MKESKPIWPSERIQYGYYQFLDHFLGRNVTFKMHNRSRRALYSKIHNRLKANAKIGETIEVEQRVNLSIDEFKNHYIRKGIPVVLKGAAKEWNCVKEWSIDYFKEKYGDEDILYVNHEAIEDQYEQLKLREVLSNLSGDQGKYYRFYPLLQRHPEHIKDFDYQWILNARHKATIGENFQVFIGGEDSYTPLHNAFSCNIFTQVYGKKEWYLYAPQHTLVFDPDPAQNIYRSASYRQGGVFNPFEPEYDKFPLFKYIDRVHVMLEPGDILYNPPYWWHSVKNPTDSIGVGYRWLPPAHCLNRAPLYFLLDLCARNPSLLGSMKLAKTDINLIQLAQTGRLDEYLKNKERS